MNDKHEADVYSYVGHLHTRAYPDPHTPIIQGEGGGGGVGWEEQLRRKELAWLGLSAIKNVFCIVLRDFKPGSAHQGLRQVIHPLPACRYIRIHILKRENTILCDVAHKYSQTLQFIERKI